MIGGKVAKNALVLMLATTGQKFVAFLAFTLVARLVGPETTGAYFYAVSVTSIFVIISDLGITPVVIRSIAGARQGSEKLLGAAIRAKFLLVPIAVLASLGYGVLRGNATEVLAAIAVACIAMSADAFHLILYGALRGRQNLKPEALGMFIGQVLTGSAAVSFAILGYGAIGLAGSLAIGSIWNVIWAFFNVRRLKITFNKPGKVDIKSLSNQAIPFAIAGIAVKVYSYVDSLMLEAFKGTTAVGYYAVAYKLTYAMQFVPLTFTAALYPALSSAFAKKQDKELQQTFIGSMRLMAAVGFPISAGLSALAPRLIPAIYGPEFSGSIAAMTILPWVLLPIFVDFPIGALLNGSNRAHLKTMAMVGTMLVNAILNFILVPGYGPMGAAWAGVFSFWFLVTIGIIFTYKDAGGLKPILSILIRGLLAAAAAWVVWRYIGGHMHLIFAFIFGGSVAVILAFIVRLVTFADIWPLWTHLKNRFSKQDALHET
ncbi:MAG: flippase [Patescibacteria group bacterium]